MNPPCSLLVIGYGNTLRRDDGVGPHVAQAIEALRLPGLRALCLPQLSPEHAQPVSQAAKVVFVDAARDGSASVQLVPISANAAAPAVSHASDPLAILALAAELYGNAPPAWRLTIPAFDLSFGETFSPQAQEGCAQALRMLQSLYRDDDATRAN